MFDYRNDSAPNSKTNTQPCPVLARGPLLSCAHAFNFICLILIQIWMSRAYGLVEYACTLFFWF